MAPNSLITLGGSTGKVIANKQKLEAEKKGK
jgi:hypothetical protein